MSDIALFVKGNLIKSFPMANSEWVTLHILWKSVSSHFFLWSTASEWHCAFCEQQSHHIFSYDKQRVSDVAHLVNSNLITSFPMTNSVWVTLHILWWLFSSHLSYDKQFVSDIAYFVMVILITSVPMTNSLWVTLHILWKEVSSHLFLWPTGCEWLRCTLHERQSHHIF